MLTSAGRRLLRDIVSMGPPSKWAHVDAIHLTRSHNHKRSNALILVLVWVVQVMADVVPIIGLQNDGVL
jgi:hypothetical protein